MTFLLRSIFFCLFLLLCEQNASADPLLRAAYQFTDGQAWSAAPELPAYSLHTFAREGEPVAVSDSGVVIFRDAQDRYFRWTWGEWEPLEVPAGPGTQLHLSSQDTVFGVINMFSEDVRFLRIPPGTTRPRWFPPPPGSLPERYLSVVLAANRRGGLVIMTSSSTTGGFPHHDRTTVHQLDPETGSWRELSRTNTVTSANYAIEESGDLFSVEYLSDHGDLVGEYGSGRWTDPGLGGGTGWQRERIKIGPVRLKRRIRPLGGRERFTFS